MNLFRQLTFIILLIFISFAIVGGCGGGDGDSDGTGGGEELAGEINCTDMIDNDGDGEVDCDDIDCILDPACVVIEPEDMCDDGIDDDGDGEVDCDDTDCELDPACTCQSPPLNTDFSDTGVFFIDNFNAVLIGLTSFGDTFEVLLADIPDSGVILGLVGDVISSTVGEITDGQFSMGGEFSPILASSGECRLENNFTEIVIDDLVVNGIPLGADLNGDCEEIVPLDVVKTPSDSLNSLKNAMNNKLQKMTGKQTGTNDQGLVEDFSGDVLNNLEE